MIGQTISHYKILEKIGEGGMGEVYLAEDTELHRKVALKFLPPGYSSDPDVLARFKREAQAAAALNHPNIITIHEVAAHEDRPFIVMAYVDGKPLRELIADGSLTYTRTLDIAIEAADGLAKAHRADVIHRDIKPENILVDTDGRVKILDFGLAKLRGATKLTKESSTLGTVYYMSPEQTQSAEVDHRSDIFSLGALLYEMIAGRVPFGGDHSAAIMYAISSEEHQPLSRFSKDATPELEHIVSKALAKNAGERYQSTDEMLADLKRERRRSDAQPAMAPPAATKGRSNTMKFAVIGAVALLVVLALLVLKPFESERQPIITADNLLAVMYFENIPDPDDAKRHGEIITNLLITDLSEASSLKVLSSQRLYDILKLKGKQGLRLLDRDTASEVAKHAGAKWMLTGSILQTDPEFILTAQLVDIETGAIASSQRVTGEPGQKVFVVVETLTREVIRDLALRAEDVASGPLPHATESEEAYRHYLAGLEAKNRWDIGTSLEEWRTAIEIDPEFPLPHFRLAIPTSRIPQSKQRDHIAHAYKYRDRAPDNYRRMIEALYLTHQAKSHEAIRVLEEAAERYPEDKEIHMALGQVYGTALNDLDNSLVHLKRVIEIDPLDKLAYNQLAYHYLYLRDETQALWAINMYIEIVPDEPNPYDSRGDIYAAFGKIDDAIASYETAIEKNPRFAGSFANIAAMYAYLGDYEQAHRYAEQSIGASSGPGRLMFATMPVAIYSYAGRFADAIDYVEKAIVSDLEQGLTAGDFPLLLKYHLLASAHTAMGNYDAALAVVEANLPLRVNGDDDGWDDFYVQLLLESGDVPAANDVLIQFRRVAETTQTGNKHVQAFLLLAEGLVAHAQGDIVGAIEKFEAAEKDVANDFYAPLTLAHAYREGGRHAEAITVYERLLESYTHERLEEAAIAAKAYYHTAIAYEESGAIDKAIAHYEKFLYLWRDADAGLPEVDDARGRLESLRQGP